MDLAGKYEKANLLGDGEVKVWKGREKARGTAVLLHQPADSSRLLRLATEYLLTKPAGSPVLDIGEIAGATILVTISDLDLLDVTAWLESALTAARNAPSPQAAPPPPPVVPAPKEETSKPVPTQQPGEFTRAFQIPTQRVDKTGPIPIPRADSGPVSKPVTQQPGEFTRAFQIPTQSTPPPRSQEPIANTGSDRASVKPGEFTQLFQVPGQGLPVQGDKLGVPPHTLGMPPHTPTPSTPSAGEFTRLFRAQPPGSPPPDFSAPPKQNFPSHEVPTETAAPRLSIPSGPVPLPGPSAPPVPKGPGEYTRIMQTPSLQAPPPQATSPTAHSPSSAQAVALPVQVSVTPPSMPSVPSVQAPSIQAPSVPYVQTSIPSPPTPQVTIPASGGPRPGISPIIFLLGGLVLVALVLVLIFALRR